MKKLLTLIAFICFYANANAQYVNIPDSNFRNFLIQKYPNCFDTLGRMDTTCGAIINQDSLIIYDTNSILTIKGIQYFKKLLFLKLNYLTIDSTVVLPNSIQHLSCEGVFDSTLPRLPFNLKKMELVGSDIFRLPILPNSMIEAYIKSCRLSKLPNFPIGVKKVSLYDCIDLALDIPFSDSLEELDINSCYNFLQYQNNHKLPTLPSTIKILKIIKSGCGSVSNLPNSLSYINLTCGGWSGNNLSYLPQLPIFLDTFICNGYQYLRSLPGLPSTLKYLECTQPFNIRVSYGLTSLPNLPSSLRYLNCYWNDSLRYLPTLPNTLEYLNCSRNYIMSTLPNIPDSLKYLDISSDSFFTLPTLPNTLLHFDCSHNKINGSIIKLPDSLTYLDCSFNAFTQLPQLPNNLTYFDCGVNQISGILPYLPNTLETVNCFYNEINIIPNIPNNVKYFSCNGNLIRHLPAFNPSNKYNDIIFDCSENALLECFIPLPELFTGGVYLDGCNNLNCIPNKPKAIYFNIVDSLGNPIDIALCNPTNNRNECRSFPVIQSLVYIDLNNNRKYDTNEYSRKSIRVSLTNNYSYTNTQGTAYINADSLGTYTITAQAPPLYKAVPASYTHTFNSYDTLVMDTFALQPLVIKDSLSINITPINFAARPGFKYVYKCEYENVGTTIVNPNITFNYDNNVLVVDSTNNATITNTGNTLNLAVNNFVPGQTNSFYVYCIVKPTATLGNALQATASINGGNANANDTANTTIRGSYDPNDKQATPKLSVVEVADNNHWINYTVRFQNTGNDTAFTVVVADTLDASKLQTGTLQLTGTSHDVKATQNDNIVYFEFLNINLPDSNKNKTASNGFVSFRVKPITTLTNGNVVPNKASIYFDYNSPILTNTANTIIGTLPLTLTAFGAIPKEEQNKIFVYWNTANEVNTSYFIIEQSTDARNFTSSAEVAAIGKGSNSYYYNIAKNNVQYVRLKMVDKNGTFSYSNIIRITTNDKQQTITVASPTKSELKINVTSTTLNNTKASLVNAQGKVVKTFTLKQGYQTIDIAALQSGLYYLQTNEVVKKVVIGD